MMTEINIPPPAPNLELSQKTWDDLGLSEDAVKLSRAAGFERPTPVQAETIPFALAGRDVISSAQTGTGKTASFVLPMADRFAGREGTYGLILAPTREIAQQIDANIKTLAAPRGIRSIVLIGGIDMRYDTAALATYPHIIVATPGRLCDHLDRGNLWLDYIEVVVLDEADRMLDMGFTTQLTRIMEDLPKVRQTMLFSATIPPSVDRLARQILHEPERVAIGVTSSAADSIEQRLVWAREESKFRELLKIFKEETGSIMVFTRSKDAATRLWRSLHSAGIYDATYIHSDRLQSHREQALAEFKEGRYRIIIATDVAARGLHIDGVAHIINYELPMEAENYVHRIGRTGRAGQKGKSTTIVTDRDRRGLREIEQLLGHPIPALNAPPSTDDRGGDDRPRGRGAPSRGAPASRGGFSRGGSSGGGGGGSPRPTPNGHAASSRPSPVTPFSATGPAKIITSGEASAPRTDDDSAPRKRRGRRGGRGRGPAKPAGPT